MPGCSQPGSLKFLLNDSVSGCSHVSALFFFFLCPAEEKGASMLAPHGFKIIHALKISKMSEGERLKRQSERERERERMMGRKLKKNPFLHAGILLDASQSAE